MRFSNSMTVRAWVAALLLSGAAACHHAQPPVARPMPPVPPPATTAGTRPPEPPPPVREPLMPAEPLPSDSVASRSLDDLNRNSPLQPAYFDYDSADLNDTGRAALQADAGVLKKYPTWVVTIEGHCDERGTKEYNLALGERAPFAERKIVLFGSDRRSTRRNPGHRVTSFAASCCKKKKDL